MDKQKFLPLAYFWLFFLKTNGFVGKRRGYPSCSAYLMMLVNYLQQQYQMPNFQDKKLAEDGLDFNAYLRKERLNTNEIKRFNQMFTEENLEKLSRGITEISKIQEIDTWINDKYENRQKILEYLQ